MPFESDMYFRWMADNLWLFVPLAGEVREFFKTIPGYPFQAGPGLGMSEAMKMLEELRTRAFPLVGKARDRSAEFNRRCCDAPQQALPAVRDVLPLLAWRSPFRVCALGLPSIKLRDPAASQPDHG
jgi:hypothetical protein